jgi:hypothetical protein
MAFDEFKEGTCTAIVPADLARAIWRARVDATHVAALCKLVVAHAAITRPRSATSKRGMAAKGREQPARAVGHHDHAVLAGVVDSIVRAVLALRLEWGGEGE